ncbi:MAG: DUF456 domain-containing protein [Anaeroplasmataceae bacterium]|nr:DUF456 domain-containing protein [Anaeroplasmataceae bacterium]MDE6414250.1 DUF456 domain-containing protein [Anaeroplasmataceae bacterium]
MICKKCGANIPDDEDICPFCEEPVEEREKEVDSEKEENLFPDTNIYEEKERKSENYSFSNMKNEDPVDRGSIWYAILGFFFPLIGLILFCVWKNDKPKSAKQCGIGALIGFILGILFSSAILCCCLSVDWDDIINDSNIHNYVQSFKF